MPTHEETGVAPPPKGSVAALAGAEQNNDTEARAEIDGEPARKAAKLLAEEAAPFGVEQNSGKGSSSSNNSSGDHGSKESHDGSSSAPHNASSHSPAENKQPAKQPTQASSSVPEEKSSAQQETQAPVPSLSTEGPLSSSIAVPASHKNAPVRATPPAALPKKEVASNAEANPAKRPKTAPKPSGAAKKTTKKPQQPQQPQRQATGSAKKGAKKEVKGGKESKPAYDPFATACGTVKKDMQTEIWKIMLEYHAMFESVVEKERLGGNRKATSHALIRNTLGSLLEQSRDSVLHVLRPRLGGRAVATRDRATMVRREQELHQCCQTGNLERVRELVQAEKVNHTALTHNMETPLFLAVANNQKAIAHFLLDKGTNPNIKCTMEKVPPLYEAALRNNTSMIQLLISFGADRFLSCGDDFNLPKNRRGGPTKLLHSKKQAEAVKAENGVTPRATSLKKEDEQHIGSKLATFAAPSKDGTSSSSSSGTKNNDNNRSVTESKEGRGRIGDDCSTARQQQQQQQQQGEGADGKTETGTAKTTPVKPEEGIETATNGSASDEPPTGTVNANHNTGSDGISSSNNNNAEGLHGSAKRGEVAKTTDETLEDLDDQVNVFACPGITLATWSTLMNAPGKWKQAGMAARRELLAHAKKREAQMARDRLRKQRKKDETHSSQAAGKETTKRRGGSGVRRAPSSGTGAGRRVGGGGGRTSTSGKRKNSSSSSVSSGDGKTGGTTIGSSVAPATTPATIATTAPTAMSKARGTSSAAKSMSSIAASSIPFSSLNNIKLTIVSNAVNANIAADGRAPTAATAINSATAATIINANAQNIKTGGRSVVDHDVSGTNAADGQTGAVRQSSIIRSAQGSTSGSSVDDGKGDSSFNGSMSSNVSMPSLAPGVRVRGVMPRSATSAAITASATRRVVANPIRVHGIEDGAARKEAPSLATHNVSTQSTCSSPTLSEEGDGVGRREREIAADSVCPVSLSSMPIEQQGTRNMKSAFEAKKVLEEAFNAQDDIIKTSKAYATAKAVIDFDHGEECLLGHQVNEALGLGGKNVWNKHRTIFKFMCDKRERQYIRRYYPTFLEGLGDNPITLIRYKDVQSLAKIHPNYQTDLSYLQKINALPRLKLDYRLLEFVWRKQYRLLTKKASHAEHVKKHEDIPRTKGMGGRGSKSETASSSPSSSFSPKAADAQPVSTATATALSFPVTTSAMAAHPMMIMSLPHANEYGRLEMLRRAQIFSSVDMIRQELARIEQSMQRVQEQCHISGQAAIHHQQLLQLHQMHQELTNRQLQLQKAQADQAQLQQPDTLGHSSQDEHASTGSPPPLPSQATTASTTSSTTCKAADNAGEDSETAAPPASDAADPSSAALGDEDGESDNSTDTNTTTATEKTGMSTGDKNPAITEKMQSPSSPSSATMPTEDMPTEDAPKDVQELEEEGKDGEGATQA